MYSTREVYYSLTQRIRMEAKAQNRKALVNQQDKTTKITQNHKNHTHHNK